MQMESALDIITNNILRDSGRISWPGDGSVRQSWVEGLKRDPDMLDRLSKDFEAALWRYNSSIGRLAQALMRVRRDDTRDINYIRSFTSTISKGNEGLMDSLSRIKCLLNVILASGQSVNHRIIKNIAFTYGLKLEFDHDMKNSIADIGVLPEELNPAEQDRLCHIGLHLSMVSGSIEDYMEYICVYPFDFKYVIGETLSGLFNGLYPGRPSIECEDTRSEGNFEIQGGRNTLYRAFYNLVNNAMKRGKASKVKILLSDGTLGDSQAVKIDVMDNGIGLPEEEDIFRYGTSYSGGTGLGLSLTQRIILDHKGTITPIPHYDDPDYKGACFTVLLPKAYSQNWLPTSKEI